MTIVGVGVHQVQARSGSEKLTRRKLAVLAADVVDYSRLSEFDEDETHVRLRSLRVGTVDPCIVSYRGQIVKNTGDGFIAAFDSCADAIRCSLELQHDIGLIEHTQRVERRIRLRMGLHIGDVIVEGGDIFGTTVNVAVRLEQIAPPGGIVISDPMRVLARDYIKVPHNDLGLLHLKNIARRVRAHSLVLSGVDPAKVKASRGLAGRRAKIPAIAVLPFRTAGRNRADTYFGEGMVDDIILALCSIRGLLVIARTSALTYRDGSVDTSSVGQALGVRYVLSGSVRRGKGRIRITAELVDIQTRSLIWTDKYDGAPHELFDLQERIATRIVWSIAPHVREAELKRAMRKRPENMNAYALVLQAIDLLYRMNFTDFSRAGELLRQAIAADDGYAAAYAYAALWQIHRARQGWTEDEYETGLEAAQLAEAAVERDPADGFAMAIRGHAKAILFRDYDAAKQIFDKALAMAPGNAMVWALSSGVYAYTGDGAQALERAQRGLRLSPVDTQAFFYLSFLALAHFTNGNFEEAVIWGRKCISTNPHFCAGLRVLAASLSASGDVEQARRYGKALLAVQPKFRLSTYALSCPFAGEMRSAFIDRLRTAGLPE